MRTKMLFLLALGFVGLALAQDKPIIESFSVDGVVNVNQRILVNCTTSGSPPPKITITSSNFTAVLNSNATDSGAGNHFRFATFETGSTSGVAALLCQAENEHGVADRPVKTTVVDPPQLLLPPSITDVQTTSVELTWKSWNFTSDFGGSELDVPDYMVVYRIIGHPSWLNGSAWQPRTSATVGQLLPDSDYEFGIRSRRPGEGGEGWPNPSQGSVQRVTKCRPPSVKGIPGNLTAEVTSPTSVLISWKPPGHAELGCLLKHYQLDYHEEGSTGSKQTTIDSWLTEFNLTNLQPDKLYELSLVTVTALGQGLTNVNISIRTDKNQEPPRREVVNPCPVGSYGGLCNNECHCFNNTKCDRTTGECPGGCVKGYREPTCSDCAYGYFGLLCDGICHCLNDATCDPTNGDCVGGCTEGYEGAACQTLTGTPDVQSFSIDATVNVNQRLMVSCTASGAPPPNITISSSNFTVVPNSIVDQLIFGDKVQVVEFDIENTTGVAAFLCRAVNVHNVSEYAIDTIVVDPPCLSEAPTISTIRATSVELTWKPWNSTTDFGGHLLDTPDYVVFYRMFGQPDWLNGSDWQSHTSATVGQLLPDIRYEFSIRSRRPGAGGEGPLGPMVEGTTQCRPPTTKGIPKNFTAVVTSATSAHLSWLPPARIELGCSLLGYRLEYTKEGSTENKVATIDASFLEFHLKDLEPETQYNLWLMAKASNGPALSDAKITIRTPERHIPGPVGNFTPDFTLSGPRHLVFTWSKPTNVERSDIEEYLITAVLTGMGACQGLIPYVQLRNIIKYKTTGQTGKVTLLYPFTSYNVSIVALSKTNDSGESTDISITTSEAAPDAQPTNVMLVEESATQLSFKWDPIPCNLRNGALNYSYSLYRKSTSGRSKRQSDNWVVKDQITSDSNATIGGLEPFSAYEFSVQGVTAAGAGPKATSAVQTVEDYPSPPEIQVRSTSTTSARMRITRPRNPGGKIQNFQIELLTESDPSFQRSKNFSSNQILHAEYNLKPNTTYTIQIRSGSLLGWGQWGPKVEFYTSEVPAAPTIVRVDKISNSAILVQWDPPDDPNYIILNYRIMVEQESGQDKGQPLEPVDTIDNSTTQIAISDLISNNSYIVYLFANTKVGLGHSDNKTIFLNYTQVLSEPPFIVVNKQINDSTLRIQWLQPVNTSETILSYVVVWTPINRLDEVQPIEYETADNSTLEHNITGLNVDWVYEVKVRARTPSGVGKTSRIEHQMAKAADAKGSSTVILPPPPPPVASGMQPNENNPKTARASIKIIPLTSDVGFQPSEYEVIVAEVNQNADLNQTEFLDYKEAHARGKPYWIAARLKVVEEVDFVVGDELFYSVYFNGPLKSGVDYAVMTRAIGEKPNEVSYLSPKALISERKDDGSANPCLILGMECVPFLLIIIAILFLFWIILIAIILCQRRKRKMSRRIQIRSTSSGQSKNVSPKSYCPAGERTSEEMSALTVFVPATEVPKKTETFKKASFFGPIPVGDLADYITNRSSHPTIPFQEEFKQSSGEQMAPWDVAKKAENLKKNRYGNILPFDRNRVRLESLPGVADSDYINASYIDGYDKKNVYIATQGPKENTFHDFWRMVWQERVAAIVMLTALIENKKKKCDQYWPNQTRLFGDILVSLSITEHFADIVVRHFELKKVGTNESHLVKHYHFTDWPDLGVPPCITSVLHLRRKVREELPIHCGPIVVHCSAGAGRAGTFIAIDAMLKQAYDEEKVYIFHFVRSMQAQRIHLVQTVEQYKFVYNAILEALQSGDTKVLCTRLPVYFREISRKSETEPSDLAEQFSTLNKLEKRKSCVPCPEALSDGNSAKNRNQEILPIEHSRVRLQSIYVDDSLSIPVHDPYINAVLCDGFKQKGHFLVTHMPLDCTIEDFWRMVVKHKSSVIIMLNDCEFIDENIVPGQYWPNDGCTQYGPFQVEVVSFEEKGMVNFRTLRVIDCRKINFEPHSVIQLQFLDWAPSTGAPSSTSSVVSLLNMTDVLQRKYGGPITVHCTDGASRSGLFCTSHVLKEQVESGQVDVFNAVKRLRRHRPQFIASLEQYRFCYEVAMELLSFCNGSSATSGSTLACESC